MKTYLLIEESPKLEEPLYLESGPYQSFLPQIGDLITVNKAPRKRAGYGPEWSVAGVYRVTARRYDVHDMEGTDLEMTCELRVEKVP